MGASRQAGTMPFFQSRAILHHHQSASKRLELGKVNSQPPRPVKLFPSRTPLFWLVDRCHFGEIMMRAQAHRSAIGLAKKTGAGFPTGLEMVNAKDALRPGTSGFLRTCPGSAMLRTSSETMRGGCQGNPASPGADKPAVDADAQDASPSIGTSRCYILTTHPYLPPYHLDPQGWLWLAKLWMLTRLPNDAQFTLTTGRDPRNDMYCGRPRSSDELGSSCTIISF